MGIYLGWSDSLDERETTGLGGGWLQEGKVRRPMEVSSLLSDLVDGIPREMKVAACHFFMARE